MTGHERTAPAELPQRAIRADYDDRTIVVYQAYNDRIADRALAAGTLVSPFKSDRMTWIKPSFCWMMYRSGWATKENQERVLAIRVDRHGFEWALENSSLSHYDREIHVTEVAWRDQTQNCPVRIQWDPERSVDLRPQPCRAIQIGLSGVAVHKYTTKWITEITDATALARGIGALVSADDIETARSLIPIERTYPVEESVARRLGITHRAR